MANLTWRIPFFKFFKAKVNGVGETLDQYLELTMKSMERTQKMNSIQLNQEQCKYVAHKLKIVVYHANSFLKGINLNGGNSSNSSPHVVEEVLEMFKLLFMLAKEIECFIKDCCKDAWIQAALVLTSRSEHISSMSFNLRLFEMIFANNATRVATPEEVIGLWNIEVEKMETYAFKDKENFEMKLKASILSNKLKGEEHELAIFLLDRSKSIQTPGAHGSSDLNFFERDTMNLKRTLKLGTGASAIVYKTTWLGVDVAMKTFDGPNNVEFKEEVSNLVGLCHPNIAALLCYGENDKECSILLELMDEDLERMMKNKLQDNKSCKVPFTILEAVGMMLQIAQGMYYLHEMKIVHRDLKAANILVRFVKAKGVCCVQAKVADFGMSRTKETSKTNSYQKYVVGTTRWMAPEVMKCKEGNKVEDPFKSDVYSFGMVCYEILTGNNPFPTTPQTDVWDKVLAGDRPDLPAECPEELSSLINKCWNADPRLRPDFGNICVQLRHLKWVLLMRCKALLSDREDWQNPMFEECEICDNDIVFELADFGARVSGSSTTMNHFPSGTSNLLDGSQFVRLSRQLEESLPNLRRIHVLLLKKNSLAASVANQFYVNHSAQDMWVRTRIICRDNTGRAGLNLDQVEHLDSITTIHSYVMPCSAYGSKLQTARDKAAESAGKRVYFPVTILEEALSEEKTLMEKLREWRSKGEEYPLHNHEKSLMEKLREWRSKAGYPFREKVTVSPLRIIPGDVKTVDFIGEGLSAAVWIVLWQGGHFVRKDFWYVVDLYKVLKVPRHPNIVYSFGVCTEGRSLFMELLDYDLKALIFESKEFQRIHSTDYVLPFSRKDSLDILLQVAKAMAFLHEQDILHMCLDPTNILAIYYESLGNDYHCLVKVAGFSSANIMDSNSKSLFRPFLGSDSFRYVAPEVLRVPHRQTLEIEYPKKIDVYSFGIVAFEVLTGLRPYEGIPDDWKALDDSEIIMGVTEGTLRPCLREASNRLRSSNDPDLMALVERCWDHNPSERPSFSEVLEGLKRIQSRPLSWQESKPWSRPWSRPRSRTWSRPT